MSQRAATHARIHFGSKSNSNLLTQLRLRNCTLPARVELLDPGQATNVVGLRDAALLARLNAQHHPANEVISEITIADWKTLRRRQPVVGGAGANPNNNNNQANAQQGAPRRGFRGLLYRLTQRIADALDQAPTAANNPQANVAAAVHAVNAPAIDNTAQVAGQAPEPIPVQPAAPVPPVGPANNNAPANVPGAALPLGSPQMLHQLISQIVAAPAANNAAQANPGQAAAQPADINLDAGYLAHLNRLADENGGIGQRSVLEWTFRDSNRGV
ncbi:hypothetical protein LTR27_003800 [Elasticomyces elasticus]|nr:hypothetical protein LTR27_003800 [Elasticomyces elasticus]